MRPHFGAAAREEFLAASRWYLEAGGAVTARCFEGAVSGALALLVSQPLLGTPLKADLRRWPVKDFPYTLVYRVQGELLIVLAVAHQRRRPWFWRDRS